jgi:hypothetical protein
MITLATRGFHDEARQAMGVGAATIMGISFGGIVGLTY